MLNYWNFLFAAGSPGSGSLAELFLWLLAFILFIIIGLTILKKLRSEANSEFQQPSNEDMMAPFEKLFQQKLITYDEYQMIQKNLRNQMVYDVYKAEKKEEKVKKDIENRRVRPDKNGKMSDKDKQQRLNSLLKGYKE